MRNDVTKSILIVDDEEVMREFLSEILEDYLITKACDGEQAVDKIKEEKFDLIITDMKMPGKSGEEVVKFIRKQSPETEIIVISGYSSLSSVSNTLGYGVSAFLSKPFTIKQIRAEVEKVFQSGDFTQTGGIRIGDGT
jgi:YesN/AraC family two-component response regulator